METLWSGERGRKLLEGGRREKMKFKAQIKPVELN